MRKLLIVLAIVLLSSTIWAASLIQVRRDVNSSWAASNPTLGQGEIGYVLDTGKLKIGDGTTAWNSLASYSTGGGVTKYYLLDDANDVGSIDWTAIGGAIPWGTGGTDANKAGALDANVIQDWNTISSMPYTVISNPPWITSASSDANKAGVFDYNVIANPPWLTAAGADTNWQTGYPVFDANMRLRYVLQTDGNAWYLLKSDLNDTAGISWNAINKTGSSLADLSTRNLSTLSLDDNSNWDGRYCKIADKNNTASISWTAISKTGSALLDLVERKFSSLQLDDNSSFDARYWLRSVNLITVAQADLNYQPKGQYITVPQADANYQPKGQYITVPQSDANYLAKKDINKTDIDYNTIRNALWALTSDVNSADDLMAKTSDVNGTYLNRLTGGIIEGDTNSLKDFNVTSGLNKGVYIKSDLNRTCYGNNSHCIDWNGSMWTFS